MESQAIQSLLVVPMGYKGALIGFLGFDSVRVKKSWNEQDIRLLKVAGEAFANALERAKAEESLMESNQRLRQTLNELQVRQRQIVQQERLRALGEMASGIVHDFNNALAPILGFSEILMASPQTRSNEEKVLECVQFIHTAAQDAANVVHRLHQFYREQETGEFVGAVGLNSLISETISITQPKWKNQAMGQGRTICVLTDLQEVAPVAGNASELREALANLIFNAVDALPQGGTITIRTRAEGESVVLEVIDTGIGMTEEVRQRCLEPFFTTKGEQGTGLGLAMVFGVLQRHKGKIDVYSEPGQGTTFCLRLPVWKESPAADGGSPTDALE